MAAVSILGIVAICLGGGMAVDRWLELRYGWRAVLLTAYSVLAFFTFYQLAVLALWRGPNLEQAALWVEREEPIFRSRLISTVQFLKPKDDLTPGSPAMVRHVIAETEKIAGPIRFTRVVRTARLKRLGIVVAVVVFGILGGAVYAGPQSIPLLQRALLVPGIPIPRRTQIAITNPNQTLARGDTVTLTAVASGVIPAGGTVHVAYDNGESADYTLTASKNSFSRTIGNVQHSFAYTVYLGDNFAGPNRVRVVLRPAVVEVKCVQVYPAYTGHSDQNRDAWDLSLLAGSSLKVNVKASAPGNSSPDLGGCRIHLAGSDITYPLVGSINDLSELHAVDGAKKDVRIPPGTTGFSVELVDRDGIRSDDPTVHKITLVADQPPTVRIVLPLDKETTVTPVAKPTIAIEAEDDFAVGRVDLKYRITRAGQAAAEESDPHGLTGTYFVDPELVGHAIERVDPVVDLNWATNVPPPGIGGTFGVRWSGFIRPVFGEPTTFFVRCTDGCRLWIDGDQVINQWKGGGQFQSKPVTLEVGKACAIKLEVRSVTAAGTVMLGWQGARTPMGAIPHANLFHVRPVDPAPELVGLVNAWPCDDQATGFIHDPVGNANGVISNTKRTDSPTGGAVLFDPPVPGVAYSEVSPIQQVQIASSPSMKFQAGDSFTLTVRAEALNSSSFLKQWQALVARSREGGNYFEIVIDKDGKWASWSNSQSMIGPAVTPGWHHLALVQDGPKNSRTLFVDGAAVASCRAEAADGWGPMEFGCSRAGNGIMPFNGALCDVRLYARAVPADQIKSMSDNPQPLPKTIGVASDPNAADWLPVPLGGAPTATVKKSIVWDLASLPSPPAVGDTIEYWAEATDTNNLSGPGVGASDHYTFKVISVADKQKELMEKLGDYMGNIHTVSDDQRDLTNKVGGLAKPEKK